MWSPTPTLPLTLLSLLLLLLTTTALLPTTNALPPNLPIQNPRIPNLPLTCQHIPSSPAPPLAAAADGGILLDPPNNPAITARHLTPRVLPYCIDGTLTGGQHSTDFVLPTSHVWTLYWVDERLVLGGRVELWKVDRPGRARALVDSTPMANRELGPFRPEVGWEYFVALRGAGVGRISWYMATQ